MAALLEPLPTETQPSIDDFADTSPVALIGQMLTIVKDDRDRFDRIDRYVSGDHDMPYMPVGADQEYRLLAKRAVSNWIPLIIGTPLQACYVDSFRRGNGNETPIKNLPEWQHWQASRLDSRQIAIHQGALKYGHSFALTEKDARGKVITKGLSAYNTAALYEDPANDIIPFAAMTIIREPNGRKKVLGRGRLWDSGFVYDFTFKSYVDMNTISLTAVQPHGAKSCPVTRFAAQIDLEGRTTGVVEPVISVQDRVNQTMFDLLVAQTYGSFKVRTITGMAPPVLKWTQEMIDAAGDDAPAGVEAGDIVVDSQGNPIARPVNLAASRWMFAEDEDVKFGTLDETPLDGYIKSLDMSIRHLAAMTQTPPHYLLGQIANLSAEALQAAETTLIRKVEQYQASFGEAWERVFQVAGELNGIEATEDNEAGEVLWRDTAMRSMSQVADALIKFKELGVPLEALQAMIPGATRGAIEEWIASRGRDIAFRKQLAEIEMVANQRIQIMEGESPPTADELIPA